MGDTSFTIANDFPPTSYETWREAVDKDLKGAPFDKKLITKLYEGIDLQPVYTSKDWDAEGDPAGLPGMAPYTRGSHALGSAPHGWDICQEHNHPDPVSANAQILTDLQRGANSIMVRFDQSARSGRDVDDPDIQDCIGRGGMIIASAEGLGEALNGVYLDAATVRLVTGPQFIPAAALLAAVWEKKGVEPAKAMGAFDADPLGVLARQGSLPTSIDSALAEMVALAKWTNEKYPKSKAVAVSTVPYHHATCTVVEDLAFSMATGLTYLRAMMDGGMSAADACRQMVFGYAVGTNQFLIIAKLRAARKLWSRIAGACGASEEAQRMCMHVLTSGRVMTVRDPWANMLRSTIGCFAAGVAGADIVTTAAFDQAHGQSSELGRRIARNTQIILQEESHIGRVVDPAGGSWYVEKITEEIAEKAWELFQEIEKMGGMAKALADGWVAQRLNETYAKRLANISKRKDPVTGVSEFPNLDEKVLKKDHVDLEPVFSRARSRAASSRVKPEVIKAIEGIGRTDFDAMVKAAVAGATIGQLAAIAHDDGVPAKIERIERRPLSEPFELLREASDKYLAETGRRPRIFMANMGPVAHHTARATYSKNFFAAGGFESIDNKGFKEIDEAVRAYMDSGARFVVVCSSDKLYPEYVPTLAAKLKEAGAVQVILAGHPGENREAWSTAGVDIFIHMGCNVLATLQDLLKKHGVLS